jgi:hypothetical protein
MTLSKTEDIALGKRKHQIALRGKLALEESGPVVKRDCGVDKYSKVIICKI